MDGGCAGLPEEGAAVMGLIIDLFAGGGGTSLGIERALGRSPDIAVNHDPEAVAMHKANHPHTKHYCENVWAVNPREATAGRPVDFLWASPDCKHFSKAKGGKPLDKKIRSLAWVIVKWAAWTRPQVIAMENVEEFRKWGPLDRKGRPIKALEGTTFSNFVFALRKLGYKVDYRDLKACDYGAPTSRKRFFLVARRDGAPIVWPVRTHGVGTGRPYRTAAECIDWSIPCPSIFEREKELAQNTLRRIAKGLVRYVLSNPSPFIVSVNHGGDAFRGVGMDEPMHTLALDGPLMVVDQPALRDMCRTSCEALRRGGRTSGGISCRYDNGGGSPQLGGLYAYEAVRHEYGSSCRPPCRDGDAGRPRQDWAGSGVSDEVLRCREGRDAAEWSSAYYLR